MLKGIIKAYAYLITRALSASSAVGRWPQYQTYSATPLQQQIATQHFLHAAVELREQYFKMINSILIVVLKYKHEKRIGLRCLNQATKASGDTIEISCIVLIVTQHKTGDFKSDTIQPLKTARLFGFFNLH